MQTNGCVCLQLAQFYDSTAFNCLLVQVHVCQFCPQLKLCVNATQVYAKKYQISTRVQIVSNSGEKSNHTTPSGNALIELEVSAYMYPVCSKHVPHLT